MRFRVALILVAAGCLGEPVTAQSANATPSDSYVCNFAKVHVHLAQNGFAIVRSGAGIRFRKVDRLRPGMGVYICDERGDWLKVFYSGPCGPTAQGGLSVRKTRGCRSGWVEKRWIDVISG